MNTPTPRTNAVIWPYLTFDDTELVPAEHARKLERELAAEREKVRTLSLACERIVEQWDKNHIAAPFHASSVMYSWASTALATTEEIK